MVFTVIFILTIPAILQEAKPIWLLFSESIRPCKVSDAYILETFRI